MAIHLGGCRKKYTDTKKVIIICNYGIGISRIIKLKIERQYKNIKIIGVYPSNYIELALSLKPDLIITTIKLEREVNIPIIDATGLLYEDKLLDKNLLMDVNPLELMTKEYFFDLEATNKENFFRQAINRINKISEEAKEILEIAFEHEKQVATNIGNLIAIPHAVSKGNFNSFIAIFRLKKQIVWNISTKEKVKIIFVIALNERDKRYIPSFEKLYSFILNPNNIGKLIRARDYDEFIKELLNGM